MSPGEIAPDRPRGVRLLVTPTPADPAALRAPQPRALWRVALMIGLTVLVNRFVGAFTGEKLSFLYKDALHLNADGVATLAILAGIPAYLRPVFGAGADLYPLFGYHRRSYYGLAWLAYGLGYAGLAGLHQYHYAVIVSLLLVSGAGGALLYVIMDAVMIAVGNPARMVGRWQSLQQFLPLLLGLLFASHLSGFVTQHWSYRACFLSAAALCLLAVPGALLIEEARVTGGRRMRPSPTAQAARREARRVDRAEVTAALRTAAASRGLWALIGFVFYLIVTPGTDTAQFFYQVDVLHLSKQQIGDLGIYGSAGALIGVLLFAVLAPRLPMAAMAWGAYLMDCAIYVMMLFLHDWNSARVVSLFYNLDVIIYNLCLFTLAARACPPRIEGTIYGLVLSTIVFANALNNKLGSTLYDHFGPASGHSIAHGWFALVWAGLAVTLPAGLLIPLLPAWIRGRTPISAGGG